MFKLKLTILATLIIFCPIYAKDHSSNEEQSHAFIDKDILSTINFIKKTTREPLSFYLSRANVSNFPLNLADSKHYIYPFAIDAFSFSKPLQFMHDSKSLLSYGFKGNIILEFGITATSSIECQWNVSTDILKLKNEQYLFKLGAGQILIRGIPRLYGYITAQVFRNKYVNVEIGGILINPSPIRNTTNLVKDIKSINAIRIFSSEVKKFLKDKTEENNKEEKEREDLILRRGLAMAVNNSLSEEKLRGLIIKIQFLNNQELQ